MADGSTSPVTLKDVAIAANVDVSVVSRVLRNDPRQSVRPETRTRILDAAARLNYRPNTSARSLKTSRSMALGLLLPDLANLAYAPIARGAQQSAAAAGYGLLITSGAVSENMRMLEGRVDGVLVASATSGLDQEELRSSRLPVLLVNRREPAGTASVRVDDEAGSALATEYLVSLGHRSVGLIAGPQNTDTARRRRRGFVTKTAEAGVEASIAEGGYSEMGGYSAMMRLMARTPAPTAVFAAHFGAAIGAMGAARRLGLRIPGDVSIIGFDDLPVAMHLDPPLTTVRMPLVEMGEHAVERLLLLIQGEPVGDVVLDIAPELVVRGSAAAPSRAKAEQSGEMSRPDPFT